MKNGSRLAQIIALHIVKQLSISGLRTCFIIGKITSRNHPVDAEITVEMHIFCHVQIILVDRNKNSACIISSSGILFIE